MAERPVGVADQAAGAGVAQVRTRERVIGADTVVEPFGILAPERVAAFKASAATFRTPARASAAQPIFAIFNGASSPRLVAVRELLLSWETIVAKTVLNPYARLFRLTAAPTNGTTLARVAIDTADSADANITTHGDASADGTLSASALAFTANPTTPMAGRFLARMHTLVGESPSAGGPIDLLDGVPPDYPIILRAGQGIGVRIDAAAALVANDFHYLVDYAFEEFTLP